MYTLVIIFYVSLLAIVFMLTLKWHEARSGKPSIISKLGRGSDHFFHAIFTSVKGALSYINKHTFVSLAQWIAFHILLRVRRIYVEIKSRAIANPHGKKILDAVRGRGEIRHHGASFYLRRISEK